MVCRAQKMLVPGSFWGLFSQNTATMPSIKFYKITRFKLYGTKPQLDNNRE